MNNKQVILRQPYGITLAKHRLNVHEMRIMYRVIEALQPDVKYNKKIEEVGNTIFGNRVIRLPTKDLLPEGSKHYGRVKKALETLTERRLTIQGEDQKNGKYELYTGLILKGKYFHNNELIELTLDQDLLPSFLALAKNYSKYLLEVAFNASSPNVMKLYQYISHHYWNKNLTIEMTCDEIKEWLQLENKYDRSKDLRNGVIEPAIRELKEKADVYFEIKEPIKLGRRIIGWKINIFKRAVSDEDFKKATEFEQNIRHYLSEYFNLKPIDMAKLEKYTQSPEWQPHIWDAMHRVAKRVDNRTVKNKRAYMIKTLINELEG